MASPEQKKAYQVIKQFKGLNTKANRTAIEEDEFSWLENAMPIGFGNLKVIPGYSQVGNFQFSQDPVGLFSCNINNVDYVVAIESDGSAEYVNLATGAKGTLAGFHSFTDVLTYYAATGSYFPYFQVCTWKNKYLCIIDPLKGYFTWDGTNLVPIGAVGRIGLANGGSGYYTAPVVNIAASPTTGGVNAQAVAFITSTAGQVTGFNITSAGAGYTTVPDVTVGAPPAGGTRAEAVATISGGAVVALSIINPGSGYTSNATVTFSSGAAAATAIVDTGSITSIVLTEAGTGYTSPPAVTFSGGGGTGANAVSELLTFATGILTVNVTNGGVGYTNAANTVVSISGGGYTAQATGQAIVSGGQVTQVIMTNHGTGYTNAANVTVTISGGGANTSATANAVVSTDLNSGIASFSGRIWISAGRNVYYSAPSSVSDFVSLAAGGITLQDSTLHGNITQIISANNFLYIFGDDSINVLSDVRVTTAGTTLFTNTNISASVGSKRPYAIFPYFRSLLFMNDYGVYALVGSTTTKISDALDGIFPKIDFTGTITAGQALINNILCAVFNFVYNGTNGNGVSGRYMQAVFFDKKWFLTSQPIPNPEYSSTIFVTSTPINGTINLYGVYRDYSSGLTYKLIKLYDTGSTSNVASYVQTALLPMGDPIRTKQALKFGVEASENAGFPLNVTVDSEVGSSNSVSLQANTPITWYAPYAPATWANSIGQLFDWETATVVTSLFCNTSTDDSTNATIYVNSFSVWSNIGIGYTVVGQYITSGSTVLSKASDIYGYYVVLNIGASQQFTNITLDFVDPASTNILPWDYGPLTTGSTIPWLSNSGQTIGWYSQYALPYFLYKSDAQQWGKYLGLTVTSNSAGMVYNTFEFEHELRTRF